MDNIKVDPQSITALKRFQLPPEIGFGSTLSPVMVECDYSNGIWGDLKLIPYGPLSLSPTTKVLHYGQEIFEGMKAYNIDGKGPFLFRPEQNAKRFNLSAKRMAMPTLPEEIYLDAVKAITAYSARFIPKRTGESLYIRPFMIATEENLGIKPSEKFKFLVIASPSAAYFKSESVGVLIERDNARACVGGTGNAKTGGNYAASLQSALKAKRAGYDQTMWLDASNRKNIEELSGMNFFAVINGKLVTPTLTETILEGITRDSVITLAKNLGHEVEQRSINIDELCEQIKSGECTECFACGTAVIITPIALLGEENGNKYELQNPAGKVSMEIRKEMLDIQEGRKEGPTGWVVPVEPAIY
jgi:branched-chain amino acid aminotransferase